MSIPLIGLSLACNWWDSLCDAIWETQGAFEDAIEVDGSWLGAFDGARETKGTFDRAADGAYDTEGTLKVQARGPGMLEDFQLGLWMEIERPRVHWTGWQLEPVTQRVKGAEDGACEVDGSPVGALDGAWEIEGTFDGAADGTWDADGAFKGANDGALDV